MNPSSEIQPVFEEVVDDGFGTYKELWYVAPPAQGLQFRVTEQQWSDEYSVRHVYSWKPASE